MKHLNNFKKFGKTNESMYANENIEAELKNAFPNADQINVDDEEAMVMFGEDEEVTLQFDWNYEECKVDFSTFEGDYDAKMTGPSDVTSHENIRTVADFIAFIQTNL